MKRTTAVTAMIAAAALMLAGCSKDSTGTASAVSSGDSSVAVSQNDAASAAPGASDSGPKQTIGGGAQGDAATTTWFTAYCGGMAPLTDIASAMPSMDTSGGPDAMKKSIETLYKTLGDAMTNTGAKLKDLPAPSFSGGDKFASTTVTALSTVGKTLQDGAAKIQSASAADLQSVMTSVTSDMSKATTTMTTIYGNIAASPDLLKVFGQIPACKKLAGNG